MFEHQGKHDASVDNDFAADAAATADAADAVDAAGAADASSVASDAAASTVASVSWHGGDSSARAATRPRRRSGRLGAHGHAASDASVASLPLRSMSQQEGRPQHSREHGFVGYTMKGARDGRSSARIVIMVVVALAVLGALIFGGFKLAQSLGLFGTDSAIGGMGREVSIFIPEGSTTAEIAHILKEDDVIASETSFVSAVRERGVDSRFQPGKYTMRVGMSDNTAIDTLLADLNASANKLTIPEGLTLEATAARVEEVCGIPAAEFIKEAHSADKYAADYPFLQDVYNNSMEGFLYPKTYTIPPASDASFVIRVLLDQFVIETSNLDMSYAASKNLTLYDVVSMASMIEKETAAPEERPLISSVLYNRLHEGMHLQICSTVVYAIGLENYDGHPLLESDLAIESPYNTYLNAGLPAGPICSPRLESIEAAAHPSETDYLYYVLTSEEGTHTFCATYEEFEAANVVYHELFNVPN
jgi:UPF0755 protein